jgi:alanyl-tRNA synthetase
LMLHHGYLRQGRLSLDSVVTARVDARRRQAIRRAHSATHLLHCALRKHLGEHAQQQGSKVDADLLRFDFSNPSALDAEDLARIETEVNAMVVEDEPIGCENLSLGEARRAGAIMLFGEKYPDVVRMVSMGELSKELCGGTHLERTGQVGLLKIIGEESVAAGTRRITALTGPAALEHVRRGEERLARTAAALRVPAEEVPERVEALLKEVRLLKKQAASGLKTPAAPEWWWQKSRGARRPSCGN